MITSSSNAQVKNCRKKPSVSKLFHHSKIYERQYSKQGVFAEMRKLSYDERGGVLVFRLRCSVKAVIYRVDKFYHCVKHRI